MTAPYKVIDCDTGGILGTYATLTQARDAARNKSASDYEIHNKEGECLVWKLPGDIIATEREGSLD